jgi:hypothetical protein
MNIANATAGGYSRSRWGGLNASTTCTIAGLASTLKNSITNRCNKVFHSIYLTFSFHRVIK